MASAPSAPQAPARKAPIDLTKRSQSYKRRDTDITLDPEILKALKTGMGLMHATQAELVSVALQRFYIHLNLNPTAVLVRPTNCPTCGKKFQDPRPRGGRRVRVRLTLCLTDADVQAITWIADNYYHGTFSRALEGALIFFLPPEILPKGAKERL